MIKCVFHHILFDMIKNVKYDKKKLSLTPTLTVKHFEDFKKADFHQKIWAVRVSLFIYLYIPIHIYYIYNIYSYLVDNKYYYNIWYSSEVQPLHYRNEPTPQPTHPQTLFVALTSMDGGGELDQFFENWAWSEKFPEKDVQIEFLRVE